MSLPCGIVVLDTTVAVGGRPRRLWPGARVGDEDPALQAAVAPAVASGDIVLVPETPTLRGAARIAESWRVRGGPNGDVMTAQLAMLAALLGPNGPTQFSSVLTTATMGAPVTGPAETIIAVPVGGVASLIVDAVGKVTLVGVGGSESLTDFYSIRFRATAANPSGTVVIGGTVTPEGVPFLDASASMVDASVNVTGSGGNAQVTFGNGALIGSGAQVTWAIGVDVELA